MKISNTLLSGVLALSLVACASGEDEAALDAGSTEEITQPDALPTVTASDNLMQLSCADFLYAARLASDETAEGAALAAQDQIANSLIWLHGYLYAQNPDLEVMSGEWMEKTVTMVFDKCTAADKPQETNLFEVATS